MNILVNPKDHVEVYTSPQAPDGFIVVETLHGYHYISEDKVYFIPIEEAKKIIKFDTVRDIFGVE